MFGVAAVIEAFVTPSPLDTSARVAVGVVAWLAFLAYVVAKGPAAVARGDVGRLGVPRARWDDEPLPPEDFPDPAIATADPTARPDARTDDLARAVPSP